MLALHWVTSMICFLLWTSLTKRYDQWNSEPWPVFDSDVAVLGFYFQRIIQENLFLQMGSGDRNITFDIQKHNIDDSIQMALPGTHGISGCDSFICFRSIGKVKFYEFKTLFKCRCASWKQNEHCQTVGEVLEECVCNLYYLKDRRDINRTRLKKFVGYKKLL